MSNVVVVPNVELARQSSVSYLHGSLLSFVTRFSPLLVCVVVVCAPVAALLLRAPLPVAAAAVDNGPYFPHFPTTRRRNQHNIASFSH